MYLSFNIDVRKKWTFTESSRKIGLATRNFDYDIPSSWATLYIIDTTQKFEIENENRLVGALFPKNDQFLFK